MQNSAREEPERCWFLEQCGLFDQHHPLGLGEITGGELIEVNTGGNLGGIPGDRLVSSLLFPTNQRCHLLAQEIVNLQPHTTFHRQLILDYGTGVKGIGIIAP